MPPKKVTEPEKKPLIGRVGTNLRVGIVGVPNVGKSTFFNVLTKSSAAAENFPFCTIDPNENKDVEIDYNELELYIPDNLIICRSEFLPKISGTFLVGETVEEPEEPKCYDGEWYPFCNSYYPSTEDVDAFARVNHLLNLRSPTTPLSVRPGYKKKMPPRKNYYSTSEAQLDYLSSKPLSFLILGKPSIGEEELGKELANYCQCVYIDPETLIREEIEAGTRAGQCIEFNLRVGRAIGIDVILRLAGKRIKTESVAHRGFVLCGLPAIPNDLYEEDPISTESAIFTVNEIFEEILDNLSPKPSEHLLISTPSRIRDLSDTPRKISRVEWGDVQEPEVPVISQEKLRQSDAPRKSVPSVQLTPTTPDLGDVNLNICEPPKISTDYEEQLNFVMDLFEGPFMIIYMVCDSSDVVNKRSDYRYDIYSELLIDVQKERAEKMLLSLINVNTKFRFTTKEPFEQIFEDIPRLVKDSSELIHIVRLPRDFPAHVRTQLQIYRQIATRLLEARIFDHDPEFFLKVDGRTTTARIFNSVKWKLRISNVHKVLFPVRIIDADAYGLEGEAEREAKKALDFDNLYECFKSFSRRKIVNLMFKWEWSVWGTHCPVAMTEGTYVEGDPKFAVHFMNYLFFLSNEDAYVKFNRNPRPYLLPPNPRCHGKIYVIGPGCSGKTAVSTCLAYLIDATVLSPPVLHKEFLDKRREVYVDRLKQAKITSKLTEINIELMREHQEQKRLHDQKIQEGLKQFRYHIEEQLFKRTKSKSEIHLLKLSSFPALIGTVDYEEEEEEHKIELADMFVPDSIARECLEKPEVMKRFLPKELLEEFPDFAPVTFLEAEDMNEIEEFIKTSDMDEIALGEEDLFEMYTTAIREEEEKYMQRKNCKGGWIVDGLTGDFNFFQRVFEECPSNHVIVLEDSSRGEFLRKRHENYGLNVFTEFHEFFSYIGKPEVAARVDKADPEFAKERIARDILNEILMRKEFLMEPGDKEDISGETLQSRRHSHVLYKSELAEYQSTTKQIIDFLQNMNKDFIVLDVNDVALDDLLQETVISFENKYRSSATVFTDRDLLLEAQDFGNVDTEGAESSDQETNEFEANRRYGDTFKYCPVTFHDRWVLWKGKKEYVAKFLGKLYFFANQDNLDDFIHNPRKYLPISKPFPAFPPPRVCVTGNAGTGKTSIAKAISDNFGLCYYDFAEFLKKKGAGNEGGEHYYRIREYLRSDIPLPEHLLPEFLNMMWFEEPYKSMGFVIDDFPKRPSDISFMVSLKTIPDVIIQLKVGEKDLIQRYMRKELDDWQLKQDILRTDEEQERAEALHKWENLKRERFDQLMAVRRQRRYALKKQIKDTEKTESKPTRPYMDDIPETDEELENTYRSKSQVTLDSQEEQADIDEVNDLIKDELPEPTFVRVSERIDDARERIREKFDDTYSNDNHFFITMKELSHANLISWQEIKADKRLEITKYEAYILLDEYVSRNKSFFERTYEVSIEVAEILLAHGYYFLSMFGRLCPVQYHNGGIRLQLFIPMEQQFNAFPVIHRQYIYFIIGKKNKAAFQANPLKYVQIGDFEFPQMPIRISIIGPPKCGKSALADRFRTELGLKVITKGQAARYVMNYLAHSKLGIFMEARLRGGFALKEKMLVSCVEACMYDPRAVTQGVIMDGFPNSPKTTRYLASLGLTPHLVLDLNPTPPVYEYLSAEGAKQFEPPYNKHFIEHRYKVWNATQREFRSWLITEYQNRLNVAVESCIWDIWERVYDYVKAAIYEIKHYHINASKGWPLRLSYMLVSTLEFQERQSSFKTFCPNCLYHSNKLSCGGFPPDRTGLVQFRKYFYYVCPEHIDEFLEEPEKFLSPMCTNKMPACLPKRLKLTSMPKNAYESGYCVTCYKDKMVGMQGDYHYASMYKETIYLFECDECIGKFSSTPTNYSNVRIPLKGLRTPSLDYKDLPPLGTLEQFVAKDIIKAIKSTTSIRPIIPGLSIRDSALLTVGLYLKVNNKRTDRTKVEKYREALELMHSRRKSTLKYVELFKYYRNPYIHYDVPTPPLDIQAWLKDKFGEDVSFKPDDYELKEDEED